QLASFVDTEFLPPEYAEIYQRELAKLRTSAPPMQWQKVRKVLEEEYAGEPLEELFARFEEEAFAAASIGQVHRATLHDGRRVAVKVQYPGIAEALEADLRNAGMIVRLARAIAPGLDARAVAQELRERVMEELDYEYEAQSQRTFSRNYRGHPFIYVPDVLTRLSRRRVLVTEYVEGAGFEEIKRSPHAEQIELEQRAIDAAARRDPEALRASLHDLGFVKNPSKLDAERLMEHVMAVGGW